MVRYCLKNTIIISLLGHITVFVLFSFTFGKLITKINYSPLIFWGQILPRADFKIYKNKALNKNHIFGNKPDTSVLDRVKSQASSLFVYSLKPQVQTFFNNEEKPLFWHTVLPQLNILKRKESVIIFRPLLPYQLQLYFKDRQQVHIELMFKIIPGKEKKSILIKRKISSGNLEADLLSARYIAHYLFIQQARFQPNNWQTVKIDLSTQK
jgi:hypothetical protein